MSTLRTMSRLRPMRSRPTAARAFPTALVVVALVIAGAGAILGGRIRASRNGRRDGEIAALEARLAAPEAPIAAAVSGPAASGSAEAQAPKTSVKPATPALEARLVEIRAALARMRAEYDRLVKAEGSPSAEIYAKKIMAEIEQKPPALLDLAAADPKGFVAFLREVGDAGLALSILESFDYIVPPPDRPYAILADIRELAAYPAGLREAVAAMLTSGAPELQRAALDFVAFRKPPETVQDSIVALISAPDAEVRSRAIWTLVDCHGLERAGGMPVFVDLFDRSGEAGVEDASAYAIARLGTKDSDDWILERLRTTIDATRLPGLAAALAARALKLSRGREDDLAAAIAAALPRAADERSFRKLASCALLLPTARAADLLRLAAGRAPTPELNASVEQALKAIADGETHAEKLIRMVDPCSVIMYEQ